LFNPFNDKSFDWWEWKIPKIKDYTYAEIEFSRDLDIIVPPDAVLGDIGNLYILFCLIFIFILDY
jgi:hypothetical protein